MVQSRDIFFALLLLGSTVSLEVQITPSQGEISVGESKFFLCDVVGTATKIEWFGPSGDRIEQNRPDITATTTDESSSTLTLYKAGTHHAGTYKCVARDGERQAEATVNVKIYQKITFTNAPSPQEFNEGDTAILVCDVISTPPPTVFWKHKGSRIQPEKDVRFKVLANNHLQIRGIKKTDEGSYTCEGRLMARGEIDMRFIQVLVNVLPTIRVWQTEVNSTADVGQTATLTCAVDGYPEPTVTWTRNGVVLDAEDKYSFNEDGSEMTIMEVAKLDEGEYTCIARNKAGESDQELSLRVFVKPRITYIVNQTTSEMEDQVTLTCEALGDPTPSINWSYGVQVFNEGEQASWTRPEQHKSTDGTVVVRSDARVSSLTVKNVKYTDAGQYLCTARNSIGEDAQPAHLEVLYAPKIQGVLAMYTWEGNAVNLSCEVQANPSEVTLVWLRDGQQLPGANTSNIKIFQNLAASFLEVTPTSENDYGSYNCSASNDLGTESKEFLLIQADVPSAPTLGLMEPFSSTARIQLMEPEATGGVPVLRYKAEWRPQGQGTWAQQTYELPEGSLSEVTIDNLKPETSYEVKVSAVNGKGEGESSPTVLFKTKPVRKPNPPKLEGSPRPKGNSFRVNWIKQDDGGSPILHYLIRYRPKQTSDWKPEMQLPSASEHVLLTGLRWDTEYEVLVVAENQKGKSQPGSFFFRTAAEPSAIPADVSDDSLMNLPMGVIAGILVGVFVLLLLAVDITCFFVNKCGLIMCLCGKPGTGTKGQNLEEGTAAFIKDESKEPIVEVRTEDECTANHNAGGPTEPNETTPLTEPELAACMAALALDSLSSSVAANSDTATATYDPALDSPSSETTTLTCSLSTPANDPSPTPVRAPAPTPESHTAPLTPPQLLSNSAVAAKMVPLIEQRAGEPPRPEEEQEVVEVGEEEVKEVEVVVVEEEEKKKEASPTSPPPPPARTPDPSGSPKPATPIPPKRRNSPKLAALHAKGGLPVSSLATASPSLDARRQAPGPPGPRSQPATPVAVETQAPVHAASSVPAMTSEPGNPGRPRGEDDAPRRGSPAGDKPAGGGPALQDAPTAFEALPQSGGFLNPTPAASSALPAQDPPLHNHLGPALDLLSPAPPGPRPAAPVWLTELPNGGGDAPTLPPPDLISLDSPPSSSLSHLANGDGARPSETLNKAALPANDQKRLSEGKRRPGAAGALTEITGQHDSLIATNVSSSKA
ncbi:neural cell adhesion molecule 1b isoform X6 [Gadus macrocephalus]|uniref:neural cell adhesion molecule 1b isoform X6 n=1 Tax=Gadus macrocephalus TaxID=80720 RepID=UPI0028CB8182|nr:neural cell adhesion molecule 1b isoform X6 [Gadus macrocephalus]